ncbi:hypothetical protein [Paraclostridium sordellii]|uniref:hypothetical protein n=1 Tax=Paraclostridium sordellii TaxID=1505 RepID=UPI0005E7450B|nr:hypothetical protein [Paeniclostridium sordellii]QYE99345.1 hypothetical protein KZ987_07550 [Paeniclostridium sordellii]CEP86957.1 Uncharacterised protein [[Clostridium] sordellii] [Paeniclostridium sordellii]CEP95294.1 Uncharacterised protein [[Clostridium] sordellii] [Paeniclostridium sordellii]
MPNFLEFFLIIVGFGFIIFIFVFKYIFSEKHFKKYCKFILYIFFIISFILTIVGYIFGINDFKSFLIPAISSGNLIIINRSSENNKEK